VSGVPRAGVAALAALGVVLACASPAAAEYGPIQLVSKSAAQQADRAFAPAISANGRYLAFQGAIGIRAGVFREDLETGAITPVATGGEFEQGGDAAAPSISADGRYVSFTTAAPLDAEDDPQPQSQDVYVADMGASPPSYELASALDGCDPEGAAPHVACGLTYGGPGGSRATGRVALSADGRKVAFITSAASDLTSAPGGSTEGVPTPAGQVVLRDLDSNETTLVSTERDPGSGEMTGRPVPGGALIAVPSLELLRGAALSADGSTVAWLGAHLPAQVSLLPGEAKKISELDDGTFPYDEPLWRRVAEGPTAPIRRIVAGDGPADPFPQMIGKDTSKVNGAEGWLGASKIDGVPQLSEDGRIVALIGNPTEATNVFSVDMSDGLSRSRAVRQLTREVTVNPSEPSQGVNEEPYIPFNGHIYDLAISADGRRIAFATARQRYPLSPPNLIGSPSVSVGLVELYVINRDGETVERITHGFGGLGEPSLAPNKFAFNGDGARAPSFGAGGRIAFASTAANLVEGDGNEESDAFLVEAHGVSPTPGTLDLSPGPGQVRYRHRWRFTLSAFSLPDGAVRLVAVVPAAGSLRATVGAELGRGKRKLTAEWAKARASGPIPVELKLHGRYRRLAHTSEGLYATVRASFHRGGRKVLHGELQVRFHAHRAEGGRR
jgi:Tol biopolymer transport system component